jgi:hypothetical protein
MRNEEDRKISRMQDTFDPIDTIIEFIVDGMAVDGETDEDLEAYDILSNLSSAEKKLIDRFLKHNFEAGVREGRSRERYGEEDESRICSLEDIKE